MFPTADSEEVSQGTSLSENSKSAASDETGAPGTSQAAIQQYTELTINMLVKQMLFCIALALATYGALQNSPPNISKHPQPVRFFSEGSLVTDWYHGQLSDALTEINKADVSIVMYYAPWDAECQHVRKEYEKVASIMGERVHVSAINCWNPGSECRLQHNKIPSWPIIMVYTVTSRGIIYKGPKDAQSMITFIELIVKPLKRVSSTEDLVNLLSICDAVAVGYTPLLDSSQSYNIWYNVALKVRESDTYGEICLASVTSEELAIDLGVDNVPSARLILWNDTKDYPRDMAWNETLLVKWVLDNFYQPVVRITPLWKKGTSFQSVIDGNPVLILFTPLNPLYEQIPYYALLREVAMEYYNCKGKSSNQWTTELIKLQQIQRLLYQQRNVIKFCQEYKFKMPPKQPSYLHKKEVVSQYPWQNSTQKNNTNSLYSFLLKRGVAISKLMESAEGDTGFLTTLGLFDECHTSIFPAEKDYYQNNKCQTFEENLKYEANYQNEQLGTSMLPAEHDLLSTENLIQDNIKHYCNLMRFAHEMGPTISPQRELNNKTNIHGLSCAKNFSLNMVAIDSVRNYHFAESLGIDVRNKKDMTAVVILDNKHESQYILSEDYSGSSVRQFIHNFTHGLLKRSLRSHDHATHTHYFGSDGDVTQSDVVGNGLDIIDLTTRTFRRALMAKGQLTIVAVCLGPCSAHSTVAVSAAARLLRACGVAARAARLDARRHDLPWQYTPQLYPAVLVASADRSGSWESGSVPRQARLSGGAVLALALRALGTPPLVRVRLALCQRDKATIEKKTCLRDVKELISKVIGRNLKYWRRTDSRKLKGALSERLQRLHQVSFQLSLIDVADLSVGNVKMNKLSELLASLAKHWTIHPSLLKKPKRAPQEKSTS